MWFFAQLEPESTAYHSLRVTRWTGPLDAGVLERSLAEVIRRHEVLRTRFPVVDGTAEQEVAPAGEFRLPLVDFSALPAGRREERVPEWVNETFHRTFDLARGPLLRATLLRVNADEHLLVLMAHHIVIDGWSMGILHRELATLYTAFATRKPSPLPELPIQYRDYAAWQRERLQGQSLPRELAYWRGRLTGAPTVLDLPFDRPRAAKQTYRGGQVFHTLPAGLVDALKALSRRERVTLFMTMLAAFKVLLWRYTGQSDLVVGTPIAGRIRKELENLIGCFTNTLILRTDCSGDPSFLELLGRVRETALAAYAHQELPFERVVEVLHPERSLRYHPLFQVMFNFRDFPVASPEASGLRVQDVDFERDASLVDLSLSLGRAAEGFSCRIFYNSDLFDASTVERLAGHYRVLLEGIAADPDRRLSRLALLPDAERHQLLVGWNATSVSYPTRPIHQLVEEQVRRTPEATAVVFEDARLTYHELNASANQLALGLTARGIGPGSFVPLLMDPGLELVVAMLGVMKAGAAFVPLDPAWPRHRIRQALGELNGGVVLVGPACPFAEEAIGRPLLEVRPGAMGGAASNLELEIGPEDPIYAIYTSGSTGTPKAAVVPHRGITNRFLWMNEFFGRESASAVLQTTRHVYDSAVWQLFWPLINGGKTVIPGPELELSAARVSDLIASHGVTMTDFVPSAFNALVPRLVTDEGMHLKLRSLRSIVVGGEEITPATTYSFMARFPAVRVVNLYGPTEASIGCIYYQVNGREGGRIPIGRPISNVQVLVLDPNGQPVPAGVPGELHLSGACLGLGYLGDEPKTRAAFVPNSYPEVSSSTLYRTGDLVRYLPDANLEFLGRVDRQVKLRGHRIELGEVEVALTRHAGVREAVVVAREDTPGDRRLVGYLVSGAGAALPGPHELRTHLRRLLPEYMIPSAFVPIDALPLTAGGKLDHRALPAPDPARPDLEATFVAPRTPLEEGLAAVWSSVLGVQRVGIHDNFFELGGHSLMATQATSRIRQAFRVDLPLSAIFETPTIAALASRIASAQAGDASTRGPGLVRVAREADRPLGTHGMQP